MELRRALGLRRPSSFPRATVRLVPAVRDPHMRAFLQQLRVDWPAASEKAATEALRNLPLAELSPAPDGGALPPGVLGTVCLKEVMRERGCAAGYDPNVDKCLGRSRSFAGSLGRWGPCAPDQSQRPCALSAVTEDLLSVLAELQAAVRHWPGDGPPDLVSD